MKLARLTAPPATPRAGSIVSVVAHRGGWVPLAALGLPEDTVSIEAHEAVRTALAERADDLDSLVVTVPDAELTFPMSQVGKIICIGLNYRDHIAEVGATPPAVPLVFAKYANSLNGPYAPVMIPGTETAQLDFEAELVLVVGRTGAWIEESEARSYVSGYAVANDVSARDAQFAENQWTRSKTFDGFCPVGPWITTADEVADAGSLAIGTEVNGEKRQLSSTSELLFGIDEIVSFVSRGITLQPGDIILTGTPPGVAMGDAEPRWLQAGDVVRCWVEGLGEVVTTIAPSSRI
jgi:2-keto-4-pentenoate hydratase/2-oxohepta-3-ene-1,7-dioic acid hydratase in catechol pathway